VSVLPGSSEATPPPAAARVENVRVARPNGWWGMAIFIAAEATLFGTIIGTYFYLRFNDAHWPPPRVPEPKLTLPLVLTGLLVATSVPVQFASSAAAGGRLAAMRGGLLLAIVVQAGYLGMQLHLFVHDVHEFPPNRNSYSSIYFTMLGAHHFHVAVGLLLEAWILLRTSTGLTRYRLTGVRVTAFYWHFVNILALVVVATQLSAAA
jgi:cytochrome c oxidase subunit III